MGFCKDGLLRAAAAYGPVDAEPTSAAVAAAAVNAAAASVDERDAEAAAADEPSLGLCERR